MRLHIKPEYFKRTTIYLSAGLFPLVCLGITFWLDSDLFHTLTAPKYGFAEFYEKNMRSYMFTGFLTLGGLLYSLKTFIIIKMHENIYAQNWYIERVKEKKTSNPKMSFYGPLKRLSSFLYISILLALLTSFAQFTIGLIDHWLAALLCCYIAASCLLLFIFSFIIIKSNLDFWLDELEKKASDLENNTPKVSNIS